MNIKEFVKQWLNEHKSPYAVGVSNEEQEHFEQILIDVCKAYSDNIIEKAFNWINAELSPSKKKMNEFIEFMNETKSFKNIKDKEVREFCEKYCHLEDDNILSNETNSYLPFLNLMYLDNELKWFRFLINHGITEFHSFKEYRKDCDSIVANHGWSEKEQKWYGWSHRGIHGFGIGDEVKEGDLTSMCGVIESYRKEHPEMDFSLPVGFKAKTLDDCRKMAIAYSEAIS